MLKFAANKSLKVIKKQTNANYHNLQQNAVMHAITNTNSF